jgi:teichuronic acid biosynthesis glycosyltransferase TuaG
LIDDLVSIITPIFNSEFFIRETIQSVQAQSYQNWQMLCLIDGGTKDRSADIIREISSRDPRVQLVVVPGGRSVNEARNHGFKVCQGRWLAFLDSDDQWYGNKLEIQIARMRETQAAISYTGYRRLSQDGKITGRLINVPLKTNYSDMLKINRMACLTVIVDQSQTGQLSMPDDIHEDFVLWLLILKKGLKAVGINEDLARYRVVAGSRSSSRLKMMGWRWQVFRKNEALGVIPSLWYFSNYAVLTAAKQLRF